METEEIRKELKALWRLSLSDYLNGPIYGALINKDASQTREAINSLVEIDNKSVKWEGRARPILLEPVIEATIAFLVERFGDCEASLGYIQHIKHMCKEY